MWLFAILIVLALGGIAALAAGKGAPLADEYGDRPDVTLPATGPLRAEDLRRVRFSVALRGYRMSEVDALLDRLAQQDEERAAARHEERVEARDEPDELPVNREGRGDEVTG